MTELRPCPFCGGKAEHVEDPVLSVRKMKGMFMVSCECGRNDGHLYNSKEVAAEAWNTRASPKVKPLVWETEDGIKSCLDAEGCGKLYRVLTRHDGSAVLRHNASRSQEEAYLDTEAAKAAAQADYVRRILSAIEER